MNKNGSGGSQIATAMAILFFTGFVRTWSGRKKTSKPPHPALRDEAA
jgi:hypothetical protein